MGDKKEAVRAILRKLPEWNPEFNAVRLDADGEVILSRGLGLRAEVFAPNDYKSLGYFDDIRHASVYALAGKPTWFVGAHKESTLAGYPFDRFEYEIYRVAILEEQEDEHTQEGSS